MDGTIVTKKGLNLIAKLVASGTKLTFTRAAVGTGTIPSGYDPGSMINLSNYKMDAAIASCSSNNDEATVVIQMSSIGIETGFVVTEAGLFAQDPDEGEILYAYLDMISDPQYIYPENSAISKYMETALVVKIGTVSNVTAYISPSSLITRKEFDDAVKKMMDLIAQSGKVILCTLEASEWTGSSAPYTQTVYNAEIAGSEMMLVSWKQEDMLAADLESYNKAFGIISSGANDTFDGGAVFRVLKKPATDITVGLLKRGV